MLRSASSPRSVDMIDGSFTSTELLEYGPGGALWPVVSRATFTVGSAR